MSAEDTKKSLGPLAVAGVTPYQQAAGEEYMNDQQKEHFRKILEAWKRNYNPAPDLHAFWNIHKKLYWSPAALDIHPAADCPYKYTDNTRQILLMQSWSLFHCIILP